MSVVLLIVFICISYLIVRIGAIALEMTGMEKSRSRFQALSAFSGTGFTTREAELVVGHPRRRKIVTYLMILGNAGMVSVIATFVLSLRQAGTFRLSSISPLSQPPCSSCTGSPPTKSSQKS